MHKQIFGLLGIAAGMKSFREIVDRYKVHAIILFIATLIWFHAVTEKYYEQPFKVQVVPVNVNPDFVIANNYTRSVTVLFRGKGKTLIALMKRQIEIAADLKQSTQALTVVQLSLDKIRVPTSLMELEPLKFVGKDTLQFRLERLLRKHVPVVARIRVVPKHGYTIVGDVLVEPPRVLVSGPESVVRSLDSLATKEVFIDSATADVSGNVALINPLPEKIDLEVNTVHYLLQVQQIGEKEIADIPVRVINVPVGRKVLVRPAKLSLRLIGGKKFLARIGPQDVRAYVDYQRYLQTGETLLPAIIEIPDNLSFDRVTPEKFRLVFKE